MKAALDMKTEADLKARVNEAHDCSMGWYRGGEGMPLPPSMAMACSLLPPWYTTSPPHNTYA